MQIQSLRVESCCSWKVDKVSGPLVRQRLRCLEWFRVARRGLLGEVALEGHRLVAGEGVSLAGAVSAAWR